MPIYNKSRGCWEDPRLSAKFSDFITSDEELDEYDSEPEYFLTDSEEEEEVDEDEKFISIDRSYMHHIEQTHRNAAATLFQKCWRGFHARRYLPWYAPQLTLVGLRTLELVREGRLYHAH